jgi:hypothetical protein
VSETGDVPQGVEHPDDEPEDGATAPPAREDVVQAIGAAGPQPQDIPPEVLDEIRRAWHRPG